MKYKNIEHIDIPELLETYTDSMSNMTFDGHALRADFCVTRLTAPKPGDKEPSGKQYPSCRLVLSTEAVIELYNRLNQLMGAMVQQGAIKRELLTPSTMTKN